MASWSTEPIGDGERQIRLISPDDLLVLCDYAEAGHAQAQRLAEAVWLIGREIKAGAQVCLTCNRPMTAPAWHVLCDTGDAAGLERGCICEGCGNRHEPMELHRIAVEHVRLLHDPAAGHPMWRPHQGRHGL